MGEIKGIYAASVSILNSNLALNVDKTILHAENLINSGCHGVVIFGSTGQAQLLSISEKIQLPIPAAILVPIPSIIISVVDIPNTIVA